MMGFFVILFFRLLFFLLILWLDYYFELVLVLGKGLVNCSLRFLMVFVFGLDFDFHLFVFFGHLKERSSLQLLPPVTEISLII